MEKTAFSRAACALAVILLAMPAAAQEADDAHIRAMIRESLDQAFKEQVTHLFHTWVRQAGSRHQAAQNAKRASTGLRQAVNAYRHTRAMLDDYDLSRTSGAP